MRWISRFSTDLLSQDTSFFSKIKLRRLRSQRQTTGSSMRRIVRI